MDTDDKIRVYKRFFKTMKDLYDKDLIPTNLNPKEIMIKTEDTTGEIESLVLVDISNLKKEG